MHHHNVVYFFHHFLPLFFAAHQAFHSFFQVLNFLAHQLHSVQVGQVDSLVLLGWLVKQVIRESVLITEVYIHVFSVLQVLSEDFVKVEHEVLQLLPVQNHQANTVVKLFVAMGVAALNFVEAHQSLGDLSGLKCVYFVNLLERYWFVPLVLDFFVQFFLQVYPLA